MKHLNANLDNVTNVELKETATGAVRFIGVDGTGDIVQAELPPNTGGGTIIIQPQTKTEIERGNGYYFDADVAMVDSACWRVGNMFTLSVAPGGSNPYDLHEDVIISGVISEIVDLLDDTGMAYGMRRIHVNQLASVSTGQNDAFGGNFGRVGFYELATGTGGQYCLQADSCTTNDNQNGGVEILQAGVARQRISDDPNYKGAPSTNQQNTPNTQRSMVLPGQNTRNQVLGLRNYMRWPFWGWDTNPDGTPVLHPDTGLPAIIVAEPNRAGQADNLTRGIRATQGYNRPRSSINTAPFAAEDGLFTPNQPANTIQIIGGAPYADSMQMGAPNVWNYGLYFNGQRSYSYSQSYQTRGFDLMNQTQLAGGFPMPNDYATTGNNPRVPSTQFDNNHRASAFFTLAPASSNTGIDYRNQQQPDYGNYVTFENGEPQVRWGWNPFFSIRSGSGAVRASDGRYYINPNPNAPILSTSPYVAHGDANQGDPAFDGIYLNGDYQARNIDQSDLPHSSWTIQLDRAIMKYTRWWSATAYWESALLGATINEPSVVKLPGDDVFPFGYLPPVDMPDQTDTPVNNVIAYTTINTDNGTVTATQEAETLNIVSGENITITATEGDPDTIVISATDAASTTEITNLLEGTDIHDVRGVVTATTSTHVTIGTGDVAYVSPTELWVNNTNAAIIVDQDIDAFDFDSEGFLRIGEDITITPSVVDVSAATLMRPVFVAAGSVAWLSSTEQYWNASSVNQVVISAVTADYATPDWLRLGDGQSIAEDFEFSTITVSDSPDSNASTGNIVANSHADTLNLRGSGAVTLTTDPDSDTITIAVPSSDVDTTAVIDVRAATTAAPIAVAAQDTAYVSATELYVNTTGSTQMVTEPATFDFSAWLRIGEANQARTIREFTVVRAVDTTTAPVTETVLQTDHTLAAPSATIGYTVQVYEELATAGDYSLVLPQTTIIRANGNVEIVFPQNTINGNVKIEIRT